MQNPTGGTRPDCEPQLQARLRAIADRAAATANLTPAQCDEVQLFYLRRWLGTKRRTAYRLAQLERNRQVVPRHRMDGRLATEQSDTPQQGSGATARQEHSWKLAEARRLAKVRRAADPPNTGRL